MLLLCQFYIVQTKQRSFIYIVIMCSRYGVTLFMSDLNSEQSHLPLSSNLIHFPIRVWCLCVISSRNTRQWCKTEADTTHLLSHWRNDLSNMVLPTGCGSTCDSPTSSKLVVRLSLERTPPRVILRRPVDSGHWRFLRKLRLSHDYKAFDLDKALPWDWALVGS